MDVDKRVVTKRAKLRAISTPEKRTEKELRHLGISLKDVPKGGRAKRSSAKYCFTRRHEKETKAPDEPSTSQEPKSIQENADDKLTVATTSISLSQDSSGNSLQVPGNNMKEASISKKDPVTNTSPVRRAKPPIKRKSPRISNTSTPVKEHIVSFTKSAIHTTPTRRKVEVPRRSPRTPTFRFLDASGVESPKEITPVKKSVAEKLPAKSQPNVPQKSSRNLSLSCKASLKRASKNLLASMSADQKTATPEGTLLTGVKKMLSRGRLRVVQGKVSKHTGMMIKLKRLQNLRKFPKSRVSKLSPTKKKDCKTSPEPSRKDHKKTPSPRKQMKKNREKVKLALERQKQVTEFDQLRRKKLRSEISDQSELWEGFPVDIRMPRLKPLSPYIGSSQSSQASADEREMPTPEKILPVAEMFDDMNRDSEEDDTEDEGSVSSIHKTSSESPKKSSESSSQRQLFAESPSTMSAFENILKSSASKSLTEVQVVTYFGNFAEKEDPTEEPSSIEENGKMDIDENINTDSQENNTMDREDNDIAAAVSASAHHDEDDAKTENIVCESVEKSLHYDSDTDSDSEDEDTQDSHEKTVSAVSVSNIDESTPENTIVCASTNDENVEEKVDEKVDETEKPETSTKSAEVSDKNKDVMDPSVDSYCNNDNNSAEKTDSSLKTPPNSPEKRNNDRESLRLKIKVMKKCEAEQHPMIVERKRKRDVRVTRLKAKTPLKYGLKHDRMFTSLPERSSGRNNRVSLADQELLMDNRMAKHACSLWVSEQRRGFQQQHSGLSSADLDTLMREAWETLMKKEKLRYFNRARIALQDRAQDKIQSSHRSRKSKGVGGHGGQGGVKTEPRTIEAFLELPPDAQDRLLKRKMLGLEQGLSATAYQQLLRTFYTNYARSKFCVEQLMKQRGEAAATAAASSSGNGGGVGVVGGGGGGGCVGGGSGGRMEKLARRLLYIAIMDNDNKLTSADQLKATVLTLQINTRFQKLVKQLLRKDSTGEDCDNVSEKLTELIEAITAVHGTSYPPPPTQLHTRTVCRIIHDLKVGTADAMTDVQVAPDDTWQVPAMCENDLIDELLDSTDESWTYMASDDVEDYLLSIQPAMKMFIAVPLNQDCGAEAFTIELSESDAEPLLSNMLLNKAEAVMSSKSQCCQLDSPSCQMSTLLLADAATQLESNLSYKKRSATVARPPQRSSHIIHAQNSQPFTSQCYSAPLPSSSTQCSIPNHSRSHEPSTRPFSPSYYAPYRPPPQPLPPPHQQAGPPQKYVTYQLHPQQHQQQQQQRQPLPYPPPPAHVHQPMQYPPPQPRATLRGPAAQGLAWRPAISSQARHEPRMMAPTATAAAAAAANFRAQGAPPRMANHASAQEPNKILFQGATSKAVPAADSSNRIMENGGAAQDANRIAIQSILRDALGQESCRVQSQGNASKPVPPDVAARSASQGKMKTGMTSSASAAGQSTMKSCDAAAEDCGSREAMGPGKRKHNAMEAQCLTRVLMSQGPTVPPPQSMVHTTPQYFPTTYATTQTFPASLRMSSVNLVRTTPPSSSSNAATPRTLYQTVKLDDGQHALDLSKTARPLSTPLSSSFGSRSISPSSSAQGSAPTGSTTPTTNSAPKTSPAPSKPAPKTSLAHISNPCPMSMLAPTTSINSSASPAPTTNPAPLANRPNKQIPYPAKKKKI